MVIAGEQPYPLPFLVIAALVHEPVRLPPQDLADGGLRDSQFTGDLTL